MKRDNEESNLSISKTSDMYYKIHKKQEEKYERKRRK